MPQHLSREVKSPVASDVYIVQKKDIQSRQGGKCALEQILAVVNGVANELSLFAATIILICGTSDFLIDLIWGIRSLWRRFIVYGVFPRADAETLALPIAPGRLAIFVPAWHEANVIGAMLRTTLAAVGDFDCQIYVGTYPNDPATIETIRTVASPKVRLVIGPHNGPTTKADNLNTMWRTMCADERAGAYLYKAVVLHDAEDVVHRHECRLFDTLIERFALVQIPVVPLPVVGSPWVAGHYLDEFADQHAKTIVAREAIGAAVPAAGVGCAFARDMLDRIAMWRLDGPFDADSLTEDYELGLRVRELGGASAFVRLPERQGGPVVAVRSHFPATVEDSVKQKSRWIAGIALAGWDRLGWHGGFAERWMRLDDRRAILAAVVLLAAYTALTLYILVSILSWATRTQIAGPPVILVQMFWVCGWMLVWRLLLRAVLVTRIYGWQEGVRSIPRVLVANFIAVLATRRAVMLYMAMRRDGIVRWDKTTHIFPAPDGIE